MKQIKNYEEAEKIAIDALIFIANDTELLPRFLNLTGINANDIREAAKNPGFLAGVLSFILAHEPTLLNFTQSVGYGPETIQQAFLLLPGGGYDEWN